MPDPLALLRRLGLALLLGAGPQAMAAGVPDQASLDAQARFQALEAQLLDPATAGRPLADLLAETGLAAPLLAGRPDWMPSWSPDWARPADGPARGERLPLRLALTVLSQGEGDEGNRAVMAAQSDPSLPSLALRGGEATLADLRRLLREAGLPHDGEGAALTLRAPLVVWPGAALRLGPGESLLLSRPDGAFVVNLGRLTAEGATLAGTGEANARVRSFQPFLATAQDGVIAWRGGRLARLGFGATAKFAGVSVLRGPLGRPEAPAWIEGALIEDVLSLAVSGEAGAVILSNRLRDMRGPAVLLSHAPRALVLGNAFAGEGPTNAVRVLGSPRATVAGNVVLGGERAGIVLRAGSEGARVLANAVWGRDGGGIVLTQADCAEVAGNLVVRNGQKGVEVRQSRDVAVTGNTLWSNHSAGLWVSAQEEGSLTLVEGNVLGFNGAGLASAEGAGLLLRANDLAGQFQQFLAGDIALQTPHVARDPRGGEAFVLSASGRAPAPPWQPSCP